MYNVYSGQTSSGKYTTYQHTGSKIYLEMQTRDDIGFGTTANKRLVQIT